jgi:hypothetical protein
MAFDVDKSRDFQIFKTFLKHGTDKVQNKESSNIIPLPKAFTEEHIRVYCRK